MVPPLVRSVRPPGPLSALYRSAASGTASSSVDPNRARPPRWGLDAFDDDRRSHPAAGAHRDQSDLLVSSLELVEDGADEDGSGRADRMAQRHRAPVDVHLVAVEVEVAHELLGDDGESLVDLDQF